MYLLLYLSLYVLLYVFAIIYLYTAALSQCIQSNSLFIFLGLRYTNEKKKKSARPSLFRKYFSIEI